MIEGLTLKQAVTLSEAKGLFIIIIGMFRCAQHDKIDF